MCHVAHFVRRGRRGPRVTRGHRGIGFVPRGTFGLARVVVVVVVVVDRWRRRGWAGAAVGRSPVVENHR
jgi:hypothetical protein